MHRQDHADRYLQRALSPAAGDRSAGGDFMTPTPTNDRTKEGVGVTPTPTKDRTREGVGVTRTLRDALNDTSIYLPVTARVAAMRPLTKLETVFTVELPQGLT